MSIILYPHQEKFIQEIRTAFITHRSVLANAPVGFGKTIISAYMAKRVLEKNNSLFFTVHRKDLLIQTQRTFNKFGIPFGIIAAGYHQLKSPIQICSINTLQNRLHKYPPPSLIIVDEAHHIGSAKTWNKVINHCKQNGSYVLGLSASPWHLSGEGFKDHFDVMVKGPEPSWLIENKYLSRYRLFAPPKPDMGKAHIRMGEYVQDELEAIMDKPSVTGDAVLHWKKYAEGKKTICFCVSIKHSKHTAEMFNKNGVTAAHLDGECSNEYRQKIISEFADGKIQIITNCSIFGEGFDLSLQSNRDITVEAVILLRPTKSLSLYVQMTGRALRYKTYPAIILDHANCVTEHGFPDDARDWTLEGRPKKKKKDEEPTIAIKTCSQCYFVCKASCSQCPECGHVFEIQSREIKHKDGDLIELNPDEIRKNRNKEQFKAKTLDELVELGKKRGYRYAEKWAARIIQYRKQRSSKW